MADNSGTKGLKRSASANCPDTQGSKADKRSKATEKDERRRDKALKKIYKQSDKGDRPSASQQEACETTQTPSRAQSIADSMENMSIDGHMSNADQTNLWGPPPVRSTAAAQQASSARAAPSATFTPTVAGLRSVPQQVPATSPDIQMMIANAVKQGIAEGIQQIRHAESLPQAQSIDHTFDLQLSYPTEGEDLHEDYASDRHSQSQDHASDYGEHYDLELSDNEGVQQQEQPAKAFQVSSRQAFSSHC